MGTFSAIATNGQLNQALGVLLGQLLQKDVVKAVLAPARQPQGHEVMQTLIGSEEGLSQVDPCAPVVPLSAAKLLSQLTCRPSGAPLAALVRSCEARAFIELCKLNQGSLDDLLLIGVDCLGRYENADYRRLAAENDDLTATFLAAALKGEAVPGAELATACRVCTAPVADCVDLRLCLIGDDPSKQIWLEATSDKGEAALASLGLEAGEGPAGRAAALDELLQGRRAFREERLSSIQERTGQIDGLAELLAPCINCYNCRVACPVCYCRECVFLTDTFRYDGEQYLRWADGRGQLKLPTDTVFYHMVRMIHMSTLCVGCGQCTSACPNDIPVMELFQSVADRTQARFDYLPGRSIEDGQPLAVFYAEEFNDVTGQVK